MHNRHQGATDAEMTARTIVAYICPAFGNWRRIEAQRSFVIMDMAIAAFIANTRGFLLVDPSPRGLTARSTWIAEDPYKAGGVLNLTTAES